LADGIATPPTNIPAAANSATRLVDFNSPPKLGTSKLREPCELGPFARHAAHLVSLGFSPLPLRPGTKRPAVEQWSSYCEAPLTQLEIERIARAQPAAGLGVCCGFGGLIACDVDSDDPDLVAAVTKVLGEIAVGRRGAKGFAVFFRAKSEIPSRQFRGKAGVLVDVLARGRFCAIPPSIHPSGEAYRWTTPRSLFDVPLHQLPVIGER
jgi:hypothetical protein